MKKKKWLLPVCIAGGIIAFLVIGLLTALIMMGVMGYGISTGRLYAADSGMFLVGENEAMRLSDQSKDQTVFSGLSTGDRIMVIHDGVEETYPARTGAYYIIRLQKGDESDLPENLNIGVEIIDKPEPVSERECSFSARYIRTDGYHEEIEYPLVKLIRSTQELSAYYEANKDLYGLGRREDPGSDYTIGFLDACDKYDDAYFEKQILVMVLVEEGSGSIRHRVNKLTITDEGKLTVDIERLVPEIGTADMALWHILIEPEEDTNIESETDVTVSLDGHSHQVASEPQTVDDPISGYCGNTKTTLHIGEESFTFMYDRSVTLTNILVNLDYSRHKLCKCLPQYTVDTEFGSYGVNLSEGYARCEEGQADLTQEQIETIEEIIAWAKKEKPGM